MLDSSWYSSDQQLLIELAEGQTLLTRGCIVEKGTSKSVRELEAFDSDDIVSPNRDHCQELLNLL